RISWTLPSCPPTSRPGTFHSPGNFSANYRRLQSNETTQAHPMASRVLDTYLVVALDSGSSLVLAAHAVWSRSNSPASASVRGRRVGLATANGALERDRGKDAVPLHCECKKP